MLINPDLMSCVKKELLPTVKNIFAKLECDGTISMMQIFEVVLTQEFESMAAKAEDVLQDCQMKGWHL